MSFQGSSKDENITAVLACDEGDIIGKKDVPISTGHLHAKAPQCSDRSYRSNSRQELDGDSLREWSHLLVTAASHYNGDHNCRVQGGGIVHSRTGC